MKMKRADAVKVMVGIGFKAAADYADDRLASKINKLDQLLTDENKPKDKALLAQAKTIVKSLKKGEEVEIEADKPAKTAKVTNIKPAAKGKGKKAEPEEEEDEELDDEEEEEEADGEDEDDLDDEEDDEDSESEDEEEDDLEDEDDEEDLSDDDEDSEEEDEDSDDEEEDAEADDDEADDDEETEEDEEESEDEESEEDSEDDEETEDEEDEEVETATKKKPSKNSKPAAKKTGKKEGGFKGAGVIDAIVEILGTATAEKPIGKKKLIEMVNKKCGGDRTGTVEQQVPSKLKRERGLNIQTVKQEGKGTRYYIAKGKPKAKVADAPPAKKKTGKK